MKLYKKNKKLDKIQVWEVEVEGPKYRTIEGFQDGKMTTSQWTICKSKNVGKTNEKSPIDQAEIEAKAKYTKKLEAGYFEDINACEGGLSYIAPMLAEKYEDKKKSIEDEEVYSSPKLDGIRCVMHNTGYESRKGKVFYTADFIHEELQPLISKLGIIAFDGEFYNHDLKNDFNSIVSLVKKKSPSITEQAEIAKVLQYHIYDVIVDDMLFSDRLKIMEQAKKLVKGSSIKFVQQDYIALGSDTVTMNKFYKEYLKQGYEGQMLRTNDFYIYDRTSALLKRKEWIDEEFEILDVLEGEGNRSGMAGKLLCRIGNDETFETNLKGTFEYYKELLANKQNYIGKLATVKYQNLTPAGKPRFATCQSIGREEYEGI